MGKKEEQENRGMGAEGAKKDEQENRKMAEEE